MATEKEIKPGSSVICGGPSEVMPADKKVQKLVNKILNLYVVNYSKLKAISYKIQVVAGIMYYVKAKAKDGKYVHLKIFKPLPCKCKVPELLSLKYDKSADDEINHF